MRVGLEDEPWLVLNLPKSTYQWVDSSGETLTNICVQDGYGVLGAVPDHIYGDFLAKYLSVVSVSGVNPKLVNSHLCHRDIGLQICVRFIISQCGNLLVNGIFVSSLGNNEVGQSIFTASVS